MKMKSKEIKIELDSVVNRLDELTKMRDGITDNLKTLQQSFVDGKGTLDKLQMEQSKLVALESPIVALKAKQSDLETALKAARSAESVKAGIDDLKVIAERTGAAFTEYDGLRVKFGEIIAQSVDEIIKKGGEFRRLQNEFRSLRTEIESKDSTVKIGDQLEQRGVNKEFYTLAVSGHSTPTMPQYGEFVALIEHRAIQIISEGAQKEQQATFAAERAKNAAKLAGQRAAEQKIFDEKLEAEKKRIASYRKESKMPNLSERDLHSYAFENVSRQNAQVA
jgi:hypothetical protein